MKTNLTLRKLTSPFLTPYNDVTKNSALSHEDADSNFIYLKSEMIYSAQTIGNHITLYKLNGEDINIDITPLNGQMIIGGVYNKTTGIATFNNASGGTFNVSGFYVPTNQTDTPVFDTTIIDNEKTRATKAETTLQTNINNESTRATNVETTLQTAIDKEKTRAIDTENVLKTTINDEANRALLIEDNLFANKEDKTNKGIAGGYTPLNNFKKVANQYLDIINDLTTGGATSILSAEQGKVLQKKIDGINIILSSDDINLDSVQELVDAIKTIQTALITALVNDLTTGGTTKSLTAEQGKVLKELIDKTTHDLLTIITNETNRAINAETTLNDSIITEKNRAVSAETILNTGIIDEIRRASDKETALQTILTNETNRAISAETASNVVINNLIVKTNDQKTSLEKEIKRASDKENTLEITKENRINKGVANGYAPLDGFNKLPEQYLNIINDLTTGGANVLLSAEQGKALKTQIDSLNIILSSNDINLDTVQEIVDNLKLIQSELHNILVNDLTTGGTTKALTAEQGKILKDLIDAIKNDIINITATLNTTINNEFNRAVSAETTLNDSITSEKNRAIKAEAALTINKADKTVIDSIKLELQNNIDTEKLRATNAENTLQQNITNENKRATESESAIQTSLNTTNVRVTTLETNKEEKANKGIPGGYAPLDNFKKVTNDYLNIVDNLTSGGTTSLLSAEQGKILKSQIDGINIILNSDDINLDTVQELVNAIKTLQTTITPILVNDLTTGGILKALTAEQGKVLKNLIDELQLTTINEINRAISAETATNTILNNEIKRAKGIEVGLQTTIDNEISRSTSAETALNITVNNEIDRATSAETASKLLIDNLITKTNGLDTKIDKINEKQIANGKIITDEINRAVSAETALQNTKEDKANKGISGGYVPLDEFKKVTSEYLNIVDNLTSGGTTSLLSAEQGKILQTKINGINVILKSNDVNLDTVQELVDAIKIVQISLSTILVNDLTTGGTTKALTAEQGKVLKELFDSKIAVENDKLLHTSGNEIKTGKLTVDNIITKGGTADQYVKGDGSLATLTLPTLTDISGKEDISKKGIAGGYVPLAESKKIASEYLNIIDNLTSGGTTSLLSAEQGKILKSQIDGIKVILASDDTNFDTLQKVVTEIKTNKIDNTTLLHKIGDEIKTGKLTVDNIITKGGTADQYVKGDGSLATLTLPTPIDITGKEDIVKKGIAGGYVGLDELKKVASEYLNIVDNLTSGGTTSLLSAEQGKILKSQIDGINTILSSDDVNLDTVQELVGAIKTLQTSLNTILVNDLTTGGTTKALTAEQGKVLKGLTDTINNKLVSDDNNFDTLQKVVTEIKTNKIDNTTLLHKIGDEIKTGKLTVDNIITKGGTADQYVKGDGSLATLTLPTPIDITGKEDISKKGIAGGYVPLDINSKIPVDNIPVINKQKMISSNYTLTNDDNDYTLFIFNDINTINITIPTGLTKSWEAAFLQTGTGDVIFVSNGVTLNSPIGNKIKGQYYNAFLEKYDTTENFYLIGNLKL